MLYIKSIILGIIQGVAEFLPISSSGHLAILHRLFPSIKNIASNFTFDILLHLGTLIAVFIVYYKTIFKVIAGFFRLIGDIFKKKFSFKTADKYQLMSIYLIIASLFLIPAAFIADFIEGLGESLIIVGAMFLITSFLLSKADKAPKGTKEIKDMKPSDAARIGLYQMIAVMPGISRSGSTISAGITSGFSRETAVEFSFILSIPAVLGACILKVPKLFSVGFLNLLPCLVAMVVSAIFGILAIKFINYIVKKDKFGFFIYYCLVIGIIYIILGYVL